MLKVAPRLPSVDALLAFEAVARLGNFELAAEGLGVGASAVAKRLGSLEELLGTPLVHRAAKPFVLTAAGKEYLGQVQQVLSILCAMPQHQRSSQSRERLRVTAPPTFSRLILVPALPAFHALRPEVEIELMLSVPFLEEHAPPADVEIRHGLPGREIAPEKVLMRERVTPLIAPSLLARLPPMTSPQVLQHATLLRSPLEPWQSWLVEAGLDWPEPEQGTRFIDLGLLMEAALCGQGVVLGRERLAAGLLKQGALVRLFDLSVPAARQYALTQHETSPAAVAFAQWLHEHCAAT